MPALNHHYLFTFRCTVSPFLLYNPQSNFSYAHVVAHTFELLAQQCLVVILTLFPVSTIKIHKAQYKYTREACQQVLTCVGDQPTWHILVRLWARVLSLIYTYEHKGISPSTSTYISGKG